MIFFSVIEPLICIFLCTWAAGVGRMVLCYDIHFYQGIFDSLIHSLLLQMKLVIFAIAIFLTLAASVHGIKTCKKIDACRCSTDEGEINLWSLAGQNPNGARLVKNFQMLQTRISEMEINILKGFLRLKDFV